MANPEFPRPLTKAEDAALFRQASAERVERAMKDRLYALHLLRETGYFRMYPERDKGEDLVAYPPQKPVPEFANPATTPSETN